ALVTQTTPTQPAAATVSVPKVVGLTRAAAVSQLHSFGFRTAIQQQASSKPPGTVLGQNPASGASVARGATVILAVSQKAAPAATTAAASTTAPATTTAPTTTAAAAATTAPTTTAQATT